MQQLSCFYWSDFSESIEPGGRSRYDTWSKCTCPFMGVLFQVELYSLSLCSIAESAYLDEVNSWGDYFLFNSLIIQCKFVPSWHFVADHLDLIILQIGSEEPLAKMHTQKDQTFKLLTVLGFSSVWLCLMIFLWIFKHPFVTHYCCIEFNLISIYNYRVQRSNRILVGAGV